MNLVLALILAIIILLCMFLIPNKLIAVSVVLIVIIMLILARPDDFTLTPSYIMSHPAPQVEQHTGSEQGSEQGSEENAETEQELKQETEEIEKNDSNILPGVETPESQKFTIDTGSINFNAIPRDPMDMAVSTIGNVINGMNLTKNNVDKIGDTLDQINWGNILVKSLNRIQKYSENNGVSGVNNSKLNNNSASVDSGSPANNVQSGSPANNVQSGSPANNVDSGSPANNVDSGSPANNVENGSPANNVENGSPGNCNANPNRFPLIDAEYCAQFTTQDDCKGKLDSEYFIKGSGNQCIWSEGFQN